MLDVSFFGMWACGHHLVSLLLHIINTLLLFGFLRYCTGRLWPSAFVACLFAIHPLHIESVAWVAERKDVLSTLFWFSAMWAYAAYGRNPGAVRYIWVMVLFALGLMSKPMLVTFPVILLIIDYWPLKRLEFCGFRPIGKNVSVRRLFIEKVPFLLMAIAVALITIIGQKRVSTLAGLDDIGLGLRVKNALVSYIRYIFMMFWPKDLAALYPYASVSLWAALVSFLLLVVITILVFRTKDRRYLSAGWMWYLITLLPVIGLLQVGPQSHADRYTYVSLTGLFIAIAWLAYDIAQNRPVLKKFIAVLALLAVLCYGLVTRQYVGFWKDSYTLASRAVSVTKRNHVMLRMLGESQMARGDYVAAHASLIEALRVGRREDVPPMLVAIAKLMYEKGDYHEAVRCGADAIEADSQLADGWVISGMSLGELGRYEDAERHLLKAIELSPSSAVAYASLAKVYGDAGKTDDAMAMYKKASEKDPALDIAHYNLGVLYKNTGAYSEALGAFGKSIEIQPSSEAWNDIGDCLVALGQMNQAETAYRESIRLDPKEAVAHYNLSLVLSNTGRIREAVQEATKALSLAPDNPDAARLYKELMTLSEQ